MLSLHSCTNIIFSKETSFPSVPLCSRQKTHSSTLQPLGQFISCFSKTSIWLTCSDQTWTRWKTREGNLHCKKALKWLFCLECWRMRFPSDVTRTAMYFTSGWKPRRRGSLIWAKEAQSAHEFEEANVKWNSWRRENHVKLACDHALPMSLR